MSIQFLNIGKGDPVNRIFIKTFNQVTNHQLDSNTDNEINIENILKNLKFYSKDHEGHIKLSLELFSKNKIFGTGPKGFRYYCRKQNYDPDIGICSTHPHNIVFQIISELGIIGISFYIIALYYLISKAILISSRSKNEKQNYLFYISTLGLIMNLLPFVPSGNFFNNWNSIVLFYNFGIYFYSYKNILSK